MKLEGIHHITCITGDAPRNVEFYVGVLGLRLVKKSVNQDVPTIYHLFYADEEGDAGSDLTFFEYPGAERGRAGAGMIYLIAFRVASSEALDFWEARLRSAGATVERRPDAIRFEDPEGLGLEFRVVQTSDEPLIAHHPDIPEDFALQGFDGARALTADAQRSRDLLETTMGFRPTGASDYECRGDERGSLWSYDETTTRGIQGAGTVHHIAWASRIEDHPAWRERVIAGGMEPTPVIDRFYFKSIYFREPSGVLFEIATLGPGFTADEALEHLGEKLALPPNYEHLRPELEKVLTPLPDPVALRAGS
ncbi:MAG: VOC family protein [Actinomycetota bacterium]